MSDAGRPPLSRSVTVPATVPAQAAEANASEARAAAKRTPFTSEGRRIVPQLREVHRARHRAGMRRCPIIPLRLIPMILALLLFAASFDGEAALRHAAKLASLGPHPWGSARNSFAAQYVAAQLREAGLSDVRLQEFESHGIKGANVIGTLRARGPEFIVLGAHHDTVPDAPGAYDDGGGVGVLLEAARVLAKGGARPRTIVFVSFDGEEAWSTRLTTAAGSRAYLKELGPDARNLSAALVIEMCGWGKGAPVLHPIAYRDALGSGSPIIAPGWLVRAASRGAREAGAPFSVGDPLIPWLYQPGVRAFRAVFYGDDLSFLQNGLPAVFLSDSSFTAFYPWYHQAGDTADKLDYRRMAKVVQAIFAATR
jgi:hypothetical protein